MKTACLGFTATTILLQVNAQDTPPSSGGTFYTLQQELAKNIEFQTWHGCTCYWESDHDYIYFKKGEQDTPSQEHCRDACATDADCTGYEWTKDPDLQGSYCVFWVTDACRSSSASGYNCRFDGGVHGVKYCERWMEYGAIGEFWSGLAPGLDSNGEPDTNGWWREELGPFSLDDRFLWNGGPVDAAAIEALRKGLAAEPTPETAPERFLAAPRITFLDEERAVGEVIDEPGGLTSIKLWPRGPRGEERAQYPADGEKAARRDCNEAPSCVGIEYVRCAEGECGSQLTCEMCPGDGWYLRRTPDADSVVLYDTTDERGVGEPPGSVVNRMCYDAILEASDAATLWLAAWVLALLLMFS